MITYASNENDTPYFDWQTVLLQGQLKMNRSKHLLLCLHSVPVALSKGLDSLLHCLYCLFPVWLPGQEQEPMGGRLSDTNQSNINTKQWAEE